MLEDAKCYRQIDIKTLTRASRQVIGSWNEGNSEERLVPSGAWLWPIIGIQGIVFSLKIHYFSDNW